MRKRRTCGKVTSSKLQGRGARGNVPIVGELLAVIAEYNKAHELDLEEAAHGSVIPGVKNEFLEDLYFSAASAAAILRDKFQVSSSTIQVPTGRSDSGGGE